MQKKLLFLLFFSLLLSGVAFFSSFSLERVYDYARIEQKIKLNSPNSTDIVLDTPANSWVVSIPVWGISELSKIIWEVDGKRYVRALDTEDMDDTGNWYTFPLVTELRDTLSVHVFTDTQDPIDAMIVATNTESYRYKIVFDTPIMTALDSISVVSRKEWWADETLKYRDQKLITQRIAEWESRGRTPRIVELTEADVLVEQKDAKIGKILTELHPESFSVVKKLRYENGKKLIWPLKYSNAIDRIVLHHTAETLEQASADDMSVMRSIYAYHARTRGWWDIGYQYIVGKDGTVYEWRIGWDYIEWAHAYANNLWTVGVSLMGNFELEKVSSMQILSLEDLLVHLAKKYWINVSENTTGFRVCGKDASSDCVIETRYVKRLHGHRDVWYTSCPGKNLYSELDGLRNRVASRVWKVTPVYNPNPGTIDPVPPEDMITYIYPWQKSQIQIASTTTKKPQNTTLIRPSASLGGKNIKIKLSYPQTQSIGLSVASTGIPNLKIDTKKMTGKSLKKVNVWIVWNNQLQIKVWEKTYTGTYFEYSAPVVRIDSWTRIPAWDTTKKYNDNLFRSRIIIRNDGWKLLVVNELPVEDYLRWLGEVSNTDNREKIKTITVAARSYARYYMERANRKYNTALYDGSDDPDSFQRYLGYSYEMRSPNVSREVKNTLGQVITYKWKIVKAWYFNSSAGRTLSYKEYCEKNTGKACSNIPYLQSVSDPAWEWKTQFWHWVWISGIWATAMAEAGKTYKEIIQYYMNWVAIEKK
jgi:peptidoglycan hydrolase-like amidase